MDRQDIFDGLLEELRSDDLIDSNYQLKSIDFISNVQTYPPHKRLLAKGEMVLDMLHTFENITITEMEEQHKIAEKTISGCSADRQGFVCREVLLELVWVLEGGYQYSRDDIANALTALVQAPELKIECAEDVLSMLPQYQHDGFGFSDLMIWKAAHRAGATSLMTFDRRAARLDGAELLES